MTSQLLKFYENTNIFITGGTGFLGRILIEKLLRSTSVSTLYILVRSKKGKDTETRLRDLFDDVIFEKLHKECPKFMHRIVGLNGDISLPDLGISEADKQILIEKVNIIFHVAATVKFDENLKLAYDINVNGAKSILKLGRQIKHLKSLMHVSTAFSNCYLDEIEERFYDCPMDSEEVGNILDNLTTTEADSHTPSIIGSWPNTYTFTKALAESVIRKNSGKMPIGVFRPAIVISTYKEPVDGWIDNLYGPTGICAGVASGLLRVLYCNKSKKADLVPVDMCVAALIASAWDTAEKFKIERPSEDIPIYNYVTSAENPFRWNDYCTVNIMYGGEYPFNNGIWTPIIHLTHNIYIYTLMKIVFHLIPALIIDFIGLLLFRRMGLMGMYKKIHKFSNVLAFFSTQEWKFHDHNVVKLWNKLDGNERKVFYFEMASLDWWAYYRNYFLGIRKYVMKEDSATIPTALKKKKVFDLLHNVLMFVMYFTFSILVWSLVQNYFVTPAPCLDISHL